MRAYARILDGETTIFVPATTNRIDMEIKGYAQGRADGWYRAKATCDEYHWHTEIGAKVNPAKEAVRLTALAAKGRHKQARTDKPGISGYMHMERMATEAIRNQVEVSEYFAKMLANVK